MTAYAASYAPTAFRPARVATAQPARPARTERGSSLRLHRIDTPVARRRRRTLAAVVVAIAVAIVGPQAVAGDEPGTPVAFDTYAVAPGETLWSIAADLTPAGEDVNETVFAIQELNAKSSSALRAGEQLLIPALD
ncbi:LysM peptidoglycan-binding domain-containing protein [Demequina sp. NBRC 110055]|uniref:LysM peptidoglycan-binding domain-containing protein n=1 Tax=Demequina sp. NBRC 110055 TaxID=1570344 RepID=UPI0009FF8787|nr:LysM peptidoglycan-binding domain-containing protein [Demequina sp. NBRC 110055]